MTAKKTEIQKEIEKGRRFKLNFADTRSTFLLVHPLIQEISKTLLTVATVTFAGSLTFLGLRDDTHGEMFLKLSWIMLALSVAAHLLVSLASLDSLISHGRTETEAGRANEEIEQNGLSLEFFKNAFTSHHNQATFFKTAKLTIVFLILQSVLVLIGGVFMGMFIWRNL